MSAPEHLAIDIAAEVRTLTEATLQGPWQVPAEVVRWALSCAARSVEVRLGRGRAAVSFSGGDVPHELVDALAVASDVGTEPRARHRAVLQVEAAGALALLWAAVRRGGRLEISPGQGRSGLRVEGGRVVATPGVAGDECDVRVAGPGLDAARAREWLIAVGRFVPVSVTVDGRALGGRFPDGLYSLPVGGHAPGEVCVAASGDVPELWLLRNGLVAARATVPGYPPFHAALEMSGLVGPAASPAALREVVTPLLPAVVEAAVSLMIRLAERASGLEEGVRRRVAALLMEAAAMGLARERALSVPMLRRADGGLVSLAQVAEAADTCGGVVEAVEAAAIRGEGGGGALLVLGPAERAALVRVLPITLSGSPAQPRSRVGVLGSRLESGIRRVRAVAEFVLTRPLSEGRLTEREREFLAELRRAWPEAPWVELTAGRSGSLPAVAVFGRVRLPRHSDTFGAAVTAVACDRRWLYPAVLALIDAGEPPSALREGWLAGAALPACRV
jgi:hypothetical protein